MNCVAMPFLKVVDCSARKKRPAGHFCAKPRAVSARNGDASPLSKWRRSHKLALQRRRVDVERTCHLAPFMNQAAAFTPCAHTALPFPL